MNAPVPTIEATQYYLNKWSGDKITQQGENFLARLFIDTYPTNTNFDEILIKVCALNCLYCTNLQQDHLVLVAEHILKQPNIDARLAARDLTLIDDLSLIQLTDEKKQSFYSFMTKYCGEHVKNLKIDDAEYNSEKEFPAFDSIAEEMLRDYNFKDHFTDEFEKSDLKNYSRYVEVITLMRQHYNLEGFTFKELDIYLNLCGRNELKRQKNNKKFPRQSHPRKFAQDSTASSKADKERKPRRKPQEASHEVSSQNRRRQNEKTSNSRFSGEKRTSNRPAGDKPVNGRSFGSRPAGSKPAGERPTGSRPAGRKPAGERPTGSRPTGRKPAGDRPSGSKPTGRKPAGGRPSGNGSSSGRPSRNRPQSR